MGDRHLRFHESRGNLLPRLGVRVVPFNAPARRTVLGGGRARGARHRRDQLAATAKGELFRVSEFARVLADLEHRERHTAASLAEKIARLGLGSARVPGMGTVHELVAVVQHFATELGFDYDSEPVRRAAQQAVLAARHSEDGQQQTGGGQGE